MLMALVLNRGKIELLGDEMVTYGIYGNASEYWAQLVEFHNGPVASTTRRVGG